MRAYEMFVAGMKRTDIARELGVTRMTISNWARSDSWVGRLEGIVAGANDAANLASSDIIAGALARLKTRMNQRVTELEGLCSPAQHPTVRLRAIQLWLKLAGIDRALPNPVEQRGATELSLVEDLVSRENV